MADAWEPVARAPLCDVRRIDDELWFFGEIDESNADDLTTRAVAEILAGIVCLDLSQVRFFGAAGIRMMFAVRAAASSLDGGMRVVCSREVMLTMQVCRFIRVDGLLLVTAPEVSDSRARY